MTNMTTSPKDRYSVLLADDSEDDRLFMRLALRGQTRLNIVAEVGDGEDAIAYLEGQAAFSDREKFPMPDVMLLDLKMPRKTGFDVLEWLKTRSSFKELVVIVVSGSFLPQDIAQSFNLGAHAYHRKSELRHELGAMFREIEECLARQRRPNVLES